MSIDSTISKKPRKPRRPAPPIYEDKGNLVTAAEALAQARFALLTSPPSSSTVSSPVKPQKTRRPRPPVYDYGAEKEGDEPKEQFDLLSPVTSSETSKIKRGRPPTLPLRTYGINLPDGSPAWAYELAAFRLVGHKKPDGSLLYPDLLSKEDHFKRAADCFWGPKSSERFIWHPWAEDMLLAACKYRDVALAGSASSGKSRFIAIWVLLNWLSCPARTLGLITSRTILSSKKSVWGAVVTYYNAGLAPLGIGKLVRHPVPGIIDMSTGVMNENAGVYLIPGEAKKSSDATGKVRGFKQERIFVGLDELTDLSHAMLDTVNSNLKSCNYVHVVAAANPLSRLDPFGQYIIPKDGWESISVEDESWPMKNGGLCLHFDALKNPNYLARENQWPIQRFEVVDEALIRYDKNHPSFWRDFRGYFCPKGTEAAIYYEADFFLYEAYKKTEWSGAKKIRVAGLDPNNSGRGDRAVLRLAWLGQDIKGFDILEYDLRFDLESDMSKIKEIPHSIQIARQLKQLMFDYKISYENLAIDSTAGGNVFCDLVASECENNDFLRVQFGGGASDLPVSMIDSTPAKSLYGSHVTEIWCVGVEYLRDGRLRGMDPALIKEMCSRQYSNNSFYNSSRMQIEDKRQMKLRTGFSPDDADAAFIVLDLCRTRLGFVCGGKLGESNRIKNMGWRKALSKFSVNPQHRMARGIQPRFLQSLR